MGRLFVGETDSAEFDRHDEWGIGCLGRFRQYVVSGERCGDLRERVDWCGRLVWWGVGLKEVVDSVADADDVA